MEHPTCRTCNTKHRLGAMYCPALNFKGEKNGSSTDEVDQLPRRRNPSCKYDTRVDHAEERNGILAAGLSETQSKPPMADRSHIPGSSRPQPVNKTVGSAPSDVSLAVKREFRRPLAKDADKTISRQEPWKAEGMSRASWYRRQGSSRERSQSPRQEGKDGD